MKYFLLFILIILSGCGEKDVQNNNHDYLMNLSSQNISEENGKYKKGFLPWLPRAYQNALECKFDMPPDSDEEIEYYRTEAGWVARMRDLKILQESGFDTNLGIAIDNMRGKADNTVYGKKNAPRGFKLFGLPVVEVTLRGAFGDYNRSYTAKFASTVSKDQLIRAANLQYKQLDSGYWFFYRKINKFTVLILNEYNKGVHTECQIQGAIDY